LAQFWLNLGKTTDAFMKKTISISLLLAALVFTSCAPLYIPTTRNAALFRGAGEFQGSVHFGQGIDAQAAVSVTENIGLMGSYGYINRNTSDDSDQDDYVKHNAWDAAIGYYENQEKICYEIFGGFGKGEGTNYGSYSFFGSDDVKATGTYNRIFIQPSIGSNHRIFNWIVSARISHVDFDKITNISNDPSVSAMTFNPEPVLFIEPSFTGRVFFGKSPIYSQFQAGFTYTTQGQTSFDYAPVHFSFGFGMRFGGKAKLVATEQ
jgi:hypothetical protein